MEDGEGNTKGNGFTPPILNMQTQEEAKRRHRHERNGHAIIVHAGGTDFQETV